ncbi:BNR/Asp-box repeat protein [Aspergillus rambellii]|uniref:BNR/Asp-box repeat protein n=1 Tax=Aspergillus rambellii TaxID=308745 RepID=A0A0F8UE73_9EURO|nr:BNR/Asp-box repeat protein [Aspergillus rambellii]
MPGHLGQKILKTFGLDEHRDHPPPPPQDSRLPGSRIINNDERLLCSHPHGTYPRLAKLSNGAILSAFTRFEGNTRVLCIGRSQDGGRSFEDFSEVTRGEGDVDNTFLLEIAPSTVLAAFRNHDLGPDGPAYYRITVCRSTDDGRSWHFLSQAAEKQPPLGIWEPFMRIGQQGEIQMTYSQEYAHDNQCTMLVRSFDGGATWSGPPQCLEGARDPVRDGMNGIARTVDNGREALVMVFETTTFGTFDLEALVSYDDGNTWGHRHHVYVPPRGHNAGSPQIAAFGDGSLAVIFMTDEDSSQVDWTKNAAIKMVFAGPPNNGQIRWTRPSVICPHPSHWPGVLALDGQTLLATYECGGAPKVKSITLQP